MCWRARSPPYWLPASPSSCLTSALRWTSSCRPPWSCCLSSFTTPADQRTQSTAYSRRSCGSSMERCLRGPEGTARSWSSSLKPTQTVSLTRSPCESGGWRRCCYNSSTQSQQDLSMHLVELSVNNGGTRHVLIHIRKCACLCMTAAVSVVVEWEPNSI